MSFNLHRIFGALCLGLCLWACEGVPKPVAFDLEILETNAIVEDECVLLKARVNSIIADPVQCGFLYGLSEDSLTKCLSESSNGRFSVTVSGLEYSKEYIYRAFVSNGRNTIYSQTGTFIAPSKQSADGAVGEEEETETFYVELSHLHQLCYFAVFPSDCALDGSQFGDWIGRVGCANGEIGFSVTENKTFEARSASLIFYIDQREYTVNVTQHSSLDIVDFKDPQIKEICVSAWDSNSDGELWYHEVAAVTELNPALLAGVDFVSFEELKFFNNVSLSDYLFEGSSVVSVSLPSGYGKCGTGKGIFKDCRYLENVDLGGRDVEAEAFMNCSSLKRVPRMSVVGERAFMGCAALEEVVQRCYSVPEMAFKNCSNLRSFSFDPDPYHPENETVGKEAFYGCTSLAEITIHREVVSIDIRAFYGCSSLKSVYFSSITPPSLGTDAFAGTHPDLKFYVPAPLVGIYKSAWPDLADRIVAAE